MRVAWRRARILGGSGRIWVLSAFLGGLALAACFALREAPFPSTPLAIPWWALAAGFGLAEVFVVHIEIRREGYSLSLSEVPLVVGLFFLPPYQLVLAQCLGAAAALLIHRRQSALKISFNVGHLALEAVVAAIVFTMVAGSSDPSDLSSWVGVLLATTVAGLIADLSVHFAISLTDDQFEWRSLFEGFASTRAMQLTNTSLGLLTVQLLWVAPWAALLLTVPTAAVLLAYQAYSKQRKRHASLQFLHDTSRRLDNVTELDDAVHVVLSQARIMFRADVAELVYFPANSEPSRRWQIGPGEDVQIETGAELKPTEGVWARVAAEEQPLLLASPISNGRLAEHFGSRGIKDAMVAPLKGEVSIDGSGVHGLMLVGNRLSDVATFDEEDLQLFATLAHNAEAALQRSRLVDRLRESLVDLQEMNRAKDEFVAIASHELRTPLTVIAGGVKTVRRGMDDLSLEDRDALLESAERAADRLGNLVEQLMAAARLEQGPLSELRPLHLSEVTQAVATEFAVGAGASRLLIDIPPHLPAALGEPAIVHRILSNLIDNALKYSDADSIVTIEGREEAGKVVVSIRDHGPGISPDARPHIFERFYQGDSSATRSVGGVGLGLYICRRLAEEINGTVWLESSNGEGSIFSLALGASATRDMLRLA